MASTNEDAVRQAGAWLIKNLPWVVTALQAQRDRCKERAAAEEEQGDELEMVAQLLDNAAEWDRLADEANGLPSTFDPWTLEGS